MTAQKNHSLIDGLACMQALSLSPYPIGCRELARQLDLNAMRVNRLLSTLAEIGLAQQDDKKRYFIGPGIHALAAQSMFASGILKQALPLIREIEHKGLTVALGVLWRDQVTYLFHGTVGVDLEQGIGRMGLFPAQQSSIGMILLADHEDDKVIEIIGDSYPGYKNKSEFLKCLKSCRKNSYSCIPNCIPNCDDDAHYSIGVPIGSQGKHVAALALSGVPLDANVQAYVDELQSIVRDIKI
ncbi:MAG: helix-turn-helix domain-containing protein [Planctomycetes bacterium]|nr:helix-turn-helix domain-containing protein [Planctomycetota bacterium]